MVALKSLPQDALSGLRLRIYQLLHSPQVTVSPPTTVAVPRKRIAPGRQAPRSSFSSTVAFTVQAPEGRSRNLQSSSEASTPALGSGSIPPMIVALRIRLRERRDDSRTYCSA